jgi:putative transcriptional regulator
MIGDELQRTRLAAGLTQQQVAAKAGITREYVSHLERGEYSPTLDVLLKVCAALGAEAWELVRRVEKSSTKRG